MQEQLSFLCVPSGWMTDMQLERFRCFYAETKALTWNEATMALSFSEKVFPFLKDTSENVQAWWDGISVMTVDEWSPSVGTFFFARSDSHCNGGEAYLAHLNNSSILMVAREQFSFVIT